MYAVIMTHSFSADTSVVLFDNEEMAEAYLRWSWEKYYNTEVEVGSQMCYLRCFVEDGYGRVTWDDGEFTEFYVTVVSEVEEEFYKEMGDK